MILFLNHYILLSANYHVYAFNRVVITNHIARIFSCALNSRLKLLCNKSQTDHYQIRASKFLIIIETENGP